MNVNKVFFAGRLTRDPDLKYLPSQMAVVEFGMVENRKFKTKAGEEREEATFIDCVAFGKTAELINQYLKKGAEILIEDGRLKYEAWEDKQGGGKRSKLRVIVEKFQFGARKASDEDGEQNRSKPGERPRRPAPTDPIGEETQFKDDEIPF